MITRLAGLVSVLVTSSMLLLRGPLASALSLSSSAMRVGRHLRRPGVVAGGLWCVLQEWPEPRKELNELPFHLSSITHWGGRSLPAHADGGALFGPHTLNSVFHVK